jgi:hypothetical protein
VLLLRQLVLEVTAGYQKYFKWNKNYCTGLGENKIGDRVYFTGDDSVGLNISSDKYHEPLPTAYKATPGSFQIGADNL